MKSRFVIIPVLVLAMLLAACSSISSASNPPTTAPVATQVMVPTEAPAATMAPAATQASASTEAPMVSQAMLMVTKNDALGSFLADSKGMTLYLFEKDTPNTSNCYDKCATAWPPLLTSGSPAPGTGLDASKLGTTTRKDGSMQVTYNSWPLYYYAKDKQPGDTSGEDVGSVWFVVSPAGEKVETGASQASASTQAPVSTEAPVAAASLMAAKSDKLGSFLADAKGMSLYIYTKDTPNTSACYDKCAANWPPLLTSGTPMAESGIDASKLGTTTRTDGSIQVTYNGSPLYYFAKDKQPGDTSGEGVGSVWYLISPTGDKVTGQ